MKKTLVALMTLSGLCLLMSGLPAQNGGPFSGGRGGGGPRFGAPPNISPEEREKFRQRLGITVQQQEQMDALFNESFKQRRTLGERLGELFKQRGEVCDAYDFDRRRETSLRKDIERIYSQILKIHSDTEEKLRRILSREQFDRLRALREEAMKAHRDNRRPPGQGKGRPGTGDRDNSGKPQG